MTDDIICKTIAGNKVVAALPQDATLPARVIIASGGSWLAAIRDVKRWTTEPHPPEPQARTVELSPEDAAWFEAWHRLQRLDKGTSDAHL